MKAFFCLLLLFYSATRSTAEIPSIDPSIATEDHVAGGESMQRYFVIHHKLAPNETPQEYGLLLVLPGGSGGADFLPFARTSSRLPEHQGTLSWRSWSHRSGANWTIRRWFGQAKRFPVRTRFTSEDFVDAVIEDVSKFYKIREGWVFTLGWSSSGHVLYRSSFENPKIRGAFIAMSRFQPAWFTHFENAKGKRYYFWHSPDDTICPYAEADFAASFLTKLGAFTVIKSYRGGHGWRPFTFYGDRIREALEWFRADEAIAPDMQRNLNAAKTSN